MIEGNKAKALSCPSVIECGKVNKAILKLVDDMVIRLMLFREDHDIRSVLQVPDRFSEGVPYAHIAIYGNGEGRAEKPGKKRRDHLGQKAEKPLDFRAFVSPKIRHGVVVEFLFVNHSGFAPNHFGIGEKALHGDGAMYLGVISDEDGRILWEVFEAYTFSFPIKQLDDELQQSEARRLLFVFDGCVHVLCDYPLSLAITMSISLPLSLERQDESAPSLVTSISILSTLSISANAVRPILLKSATTMVRRACLIM